MTNAEKYIGDEDTIDEFIDEIADYIIIDISDEFCKEDKGYIKQKLTKFFQKDLKPTLTEDERVILRNIQKGLFRKGIISRTKTGELLVYIQETGEKIELYIFNHLFRFIKERRRILNRRIIKIKENKDEYYRIT